MPAYSIERIKQKCFWEYTFNDDQILQMARGEKGEYGIRFLFQKIFCNSTFPYLDLQIFSKEILKKELKNCKVPKNYNTAFLNRRKKILLNIFGIEKHTIEDLEWKIK